jgi:hypothetical protein
MNNSIHNLLKILSTGFIALFFMSILLFWAKKPFEAGLYSNSFDEKQNEISKTITGFVKDLDKNSTLGIERYIHWGSSTMCPGIVHTGYEWMYNYPIYYLAAAFQDKSPQIIYYDKESGLVVYCKVVLKDVDGKSKWIKEIFGYAGPQGISQTPDEKLGRFMNPKTALYRWSPDQVVLFDNDLSRFFLVKFKKKTVLKSIEFPAGDDRRPLQIGLLEKNPMIRFDRPYPPEDEKNTLVLAQNGTILKFNAEKMDYEGFAGYLPDKGFYNRLLLSYSCRPVYENKKYAGLLVVGISDGIVSINITSFDVRGKRLKQEIISANTWNTSGGSSLWIAKYLLESLHPPILNLLTAYTAQGVDAFFNAQQSLFILPNSIVGMIQRNSDLRRPGQGVEFFFIRMIFILPSIIFSLILAWRVSWEARNVGFPKQERTYWVLGTILFGLPAYITWRITRPAVVQVTCQNCGRLRRPDFDTCQHCKSPWHVPDLTPPAWRVYDAPDPLTRTEIQNKEVTAGSLKK